MPGSVSLDTLIGSGSPSLSKTAKEIENTRRRLGAIGMGVEAEPETSESFMTKVFDFLNRFERGAGGAAGEIISPELSSTPNFDPFSAFARGFKKEENITPREIAVSKGLSEEPLFSVGGDRFRFSPSPAGIAGFVGSVLNPLDPINWLTFGVGGAIAKTGSKGIPLLERAFGQEGATRLAGELGEDVVKGLRGNTVADLVNSIIESNPQARKTLQELTAGVDLKKRLPTEQKSLTMGISAPIINAKLAEVAIPGSKPIVTNLSKLGTSFMQTPVGESLGKAFSTLHRVSGRATRGEFFTVMRGLGGDGPPPITKVATGEVGRMINDIFSGTDSAMRSDINDRMRYLEESAQGIPEAKLNQLSLELSPQGRFSLLFDLYGKQGGIDEIQKLGFSQGEAVFSSLWDDFRKQVPKWFDEHGVKIDELPAYMTYMFRKPPSSADVAALRLKERGEVPYGYVRLYRGEPAVKGEVSDWIAQGKEEQGIAGAEGRWFTDTLEEAEWYKKEAGDTARITYVDVPQEFAERFRARNLPEAMRYSRRPDVEFLLPRELADRARPVDSPTPFDEELLKVAQAQMPQLRQRVLTSGYMSPQEINLTLTGAGLKPLVVENLYEIMSTVNERFIRAQYAVEALDKLRSSFAMYADDLRSIKKNYIPEGYGVYKTKIDEKTGQMSLVRADTAEEGAFLAHLSTKKGEAPQGVFALPDEIAKAWEDYSKLHYDPIERNNFLRFFDKATSEFRTLAYMVTPGHVPRDMVSNLYNLWLMGMRSITRLPEMWKLSKMVEKDIIFIKPEKGGKVPPPPNDKWTYLKKGRQGLYLSTDSKGAVAFVTKKNADAVTSMLNRRVTVKATYYDMIDQANKKGVLDTGWWSVDGPDTRMLALAPMRKRLLTLDPQKHEYVRRMVQITKTTDNTTRLMGFIDRLQKGDDFATAAAQVKKYLFDYSDLTTFEKTWMRRVFPFYCLSESAEALTRNGWKKYNEVVVGEDVLTYNIKTRKTEWKPVLALFADTYKGKMMRMRGQSLNVLCTPDHKWIAERNRKGKPVELVEAKSINTNCKLVVCGEYDSPKDYPMPDDILRIVGWLSTDGYSRQRGSYWEHIIYQHPNKFVDEIRETLGRCGDFHEVTHPNGTIQFYLKGDLRREVCSYFHTKDDLWNIVVNLSKRQLDILYDVMYKADGTTKQGTCEEFFAAQDDTTRNVFQVLCYLRGRLANLGNRGMYIRQEGRHALKYSALTVSMVDYEGVVWCPRTENDTWVARDNGKIFATGNTWMRKNIPLQIKEAFRQPGKIGTVGKYHRAASEEQEPGVTPSFLEQGASMLLPGGNMFLTSPLPYQDLARLPMDWQTISEQLSNVNPMLRVPIELAMNKQFFSNLPIEQYANEPAKGLLGELGLDRRGPAYALENIPLYRNVATMTPPLPDSGPLGELLGALGITSGEEMSDEEGRRLARILSFMAGPQVFSAERAGEIATYEERDRLRALVRLLKDQGIEVPGVKDIL